MSPHRVQLNSLWSYDPRGNGFFKPRRTFRLGCREGRPLLADEIDIDRVAIG